MAHVSQPPSGQDVERAPSMASISRTVIGSNHNLNNTPGANHQESIDLQSNALIEGVLGPNRDGRVRNPVPSKLKGKTDNKQGNFGVMHMGTSPSKKTDSHGKDSAAERDAAARRTSENTASRAKAAQQEKYVPPKKRSLEAGLAEIGNRGSPFAISKNNDRSRARPLAPDETKFEQARLLTLLRSIQPLTVVDQLCKAIAYFGGIPGAPPPEDGIFPESANTRETGALFIGWVAEIFPDVAQRSPEVPLREPPASKKKSRPSVAKKASDVPEPQAPNSQNGFGFGPAVVPSWGTQHPASTAPHLPVAPDNVQAQATGLHQVPNTANASVGDASTPAKTQKQDTSADASAKKRRGRPKGSTNKKGKDGANGDVPVNNNEDLDTTVNDPMIDPQLQTTAQAVMSASTNAYAGGYPNPTDPSMPMKPIQHYQYPVQNWSSQQKNQTGQAAPPSEELSPQERAILEAFRNPGTDNMSNAIVAATAPVATMGGPSQISTENAPKKRKRATNKPKATAAVAAVDGLNSSVAAASTHASTNLIGTPNMQKTNDQTLQQTQTQTSPQWTPSTKQTPILPPAKKARVRKPKPPAPSKDTPTQPQATASVTASTPTITPNTIPDSQPAASQPTTQPVSRPPVEGLEAHYERFANYQQQSGRSNTPTHPQHQRQQSKPGSVPPQQTTPLLPHQQVQMQQQKSQQGIQSNAQKYDIKTSQNPLSTRPSSTGMYNAQRNQAASYGQQYPSQASQLYAGHQASPQLSNATTSDTTTTMSSINPMGNASSVTNALSNTAPSNNSYARSYGSSSLSQASPQFPQPTNSYRTASPHTISQPAPTYSHNDNNFRTSAHSITQPTTSYAQSDNSYRAPTSHSLAQPTTTYTSARSQPSTTHQNPYNSFSDSSFLDLPGLDSMGHSSGNSNTSNSGLGLSGYGQNLNLGHNTSRSSGNNNLYNSSTGLSHGYDNSSNDFSRGAGRSSSNANTGGYGGGAADLGYFHNHKRV